MWASSTTAWQKRSVSYYEGNYNILELIRSIISYLVCEYCDTLSVYGLHLKGSHYLVDNVESQEFVCHEKEQEGNGSKRG